MFLITHNYSFVNTGNINVIYVCHSQNDEDDKKLYDIVAEFDNKKRILLDKNLIFYETVTTVIKKYTSFRFLRIWYNLGLLQQKNRHNIYTHGGIV